MNNKTTVSFTRVLSAYHHDDRLVVINLSVLVFITYLQEGNVYATKTEA